MTASTRVLLALPLVLFLALAAVFAFRVTDGADRTVVPSALIGKTAPDTAFPPLSDAHPGVASADFAGKVTLVNVFASWCAPCRVEHPYLMELARTPGLQTVGLNYKDRVTAARDFLTELGNPYDAIGVDPDGRRVIEWGVYGVPETYVVGPDGVIRAKHVGPLTEEVLAGAFGDTMRALLADAAPVPGA
ncbi:DsbE family thiol:disulfide interchange protein [Acuticoccus sp. MNP-M23]|uniref:DsbE family thiol:disulfide interchange protein n=1 Tax=Acuticoccus sp. MNP-M23 TaxID=3072793 RepID=UPI002814BA47|nr:DsbE family thiol:disulfide interchange protein [Acuticoccus sp. MNP-M23]WMS40831.1 DsbE family thiol:disulfide interchange protein [Acuticoccus sp. MNP-M23]